MLPFDVKRQGIVVGEGSSMLVLERESHAKARGANILGYLRGYGSLSDSFHPPRQIRPASGKPERWKSHPLG